MTANLPAGNPVARYLDIARAVERSGTGDCAGLQRRRRGDQLEYRSRFVGVRNGLVPPLGHLGFTQGCIVFVQFFLVVAGFLFHLVQLRLGIGIVNLTGVVGVKVRLGGHAQDLAGLDIHHDAHSTVLHLMLLYGIFQVLFQIVLHCFIDGQHQALSVLRIVDLLLTEGHGSSLGVAHRGDDAVGTGQGLVVVGFQAIGAGAVIAGKAQHSGRQVAIGIIAHGIFA